MEIGEVMQGIINHGPVSPEEYKKQDEEFENILTDAYKNKIMELETKLKKSEVQHTMTQAVGIELKEQHDEAMIKIMDLSDKIVKLETKIEYNDETINMLRCLVEIGLQRD